MLVKTLAAQTLSVLGTERQQQDGREGPAWVLIAAMMNAAAGLQPWSGPSGPGYCVRWLMNQSRASPAAMSSVPGSSNRCVAPGTTARSFSQRSSPGPGG